MARKRKKRGRWYYKPALLLCSVMMAALMAELVLRVMTEPSDVPRDLFYKYDLVLGWAKRANIEEKISAAEYSVMQRTNSKGILGPEYSYEKNTNEYRVVTLGDSFAEGYSVEFGQLFSEVLKQTLNAETGNEVYQVINAGVGGYSTDQELLYFEREIEKCHPDMTVVMFYHNDVWVNSQPRNFGGGLKPLFKIDREELVLSNVPVPAVYLFDAPEGHGLSRSEVFFYKTKRWFQNHSLVFVKVREAISKSLQLYDLAIKTGLAKERGALSQLLEATAPGRARVPDMFCVWEVEYKPELEQGWEITKLLLRRLRAQTHAAGGELLVFYVPAAWGVYEEKWQRLLKQYGLPAERWDAHRSGRELGMICKRNDIPFVSGTKPFIEKAKQLQTEEKLLYYPRDSHWNVLGHRLAGEILAQRILALRQGKEAVFSRGERALGDGAGL